MKEIKEFWIRLGYEKKNVLKMAEKSADILTYKEENITQKIKDMENLGYTREEIIKMTIDSPSIFDYSIETMKNKIQKLIKLGYTIEEVIKMTVDSPKIFDYDIENIKTKMDSIEKQGYTHEQVIEMTVSFAKILDFSIENLQEKIRCYKSLGLDFILIEDPKQLIQSSALTYARYMFLTNKGITIDENNYKQLFLKQKDFERKYGITNSSVLERYNYNGSLKKTKSTQELGRETVEEQKNPELLDEIMKVQVEKQKEMECNEQKE